MPTKTFCVKVEYDDDVKRVEGTSAEEPAPGMLVIKDQDNVAARFNKVERWWPESKSS